MISNSEVKIIELPEHSIIWLQIPEFLSLGDVEQYTDRFSIVVSQNQSFGCIFSYLAGSPKKSKAAHKLEKEWLHHHKPQLSKLCFGLAMVSNPSIQSLLTKIVVKGFAQQFLGCECNLLFTVEEAKNWLIKRSEQMI